MLFSYRDDTLAARHMNTSANIPYKKVSREKVELPRSKKRAYDDEATLKGRCFVPEKY